MTVMMQPHSLAIRDGIAPTGVILVWKAGNGATLDKQAMSDDQRSPTIGHLLNDILP